MELLPFFAAYIVNFIILALAATVSKSKKDLLIGIFAGCAMMFLSILIQH